MSMASVHSAEIEVTILMPCLNEAETIQICISKATGWLQSCNVHGEVLVADNGSTDQSRDLAEKAGARVVAVPRRGYGNALLGGIRAARGKHIIMGDCDDSYDFSDLTAFLEQLRAGNDLVMGNRFAGGIAKGAMPALHRYLGNPVLTRVGRIFFRSRCGDFHCGLRGFKRASILALDLRTTGMEFASEMVVKATLHGLRIAEVPTTLRPDGRSRSPHLKSWRDGWRHLRFLLMYSPRWLFFYPGLALMGIGTVLSCLLLFGPLHIGTVVFDVHTLLYAAIAVILGFQCAAFAVFTKVFAISEKLLPEDPRMHKLSRFANLETGLIGGVLLFLIGIAGAVYSLVSWEITGFGTMEPGQTLRIVIPSVTFLTIGFQIILYSFFLSILSLKRKG
jgi:glycosyltransferase involved in cell wall biosynthesis